MLNAFAITFGDRWPAAETYQTEEPETLILVRTREAALMRDSTMSQTGVVDITVWVDDWQMQCCGDRFAVGDEVAWTLREIDSEWLETVLGADVARRIDAAEEHHGRIAEDTPVTVGAVVSIEAVHCRYAPRPGGRERSFHPVPLSGSVSTLDSADGWTPDRGDLKFAGYIVGLTSTRTRQPA